MRSYCVKQKKVTECVPGSERYQLTKNGRTMLKCTFAECGITKTLFVKKTESGTGKRSSPSSGAGFLDIGNSHSLGEMALKAGLKGAFNLGKIGASRAVKSDFAKQKIKGMVNTYLDQALDSFTSDL